MANKYANENGHTTYPKWVDHPTLKDGDYPKRVIVQDEEEEAALGKAKKPAGWDK